MAAMQNTMERDVAYLKSLAEAGRNAPLQVGPYLIAGGAWFGGASAVLTLAQLGLINAPSSMVAWIWLIAAAGFGLTLFRLIKRDRAVGNTGRNQLIGAVWSGAGFGIFVFWLAATVMAMRAGNGEIMGTISLAVLVIYGLVWWITGSLTAVGWMRGIALLAASSAIIVALATGTPYVWLAYTGALIACALLPGLYLVRIGGRAA